MAIMEVKAANLPSVDVAQFHRDGYTIVRSVFTREEVTKLRDDTVRIANDAKARNVVFRVHGAITPVQDLATWDELGTVLSDPRIISIAKQLLDVPEVVYYGDSNMQVGAGGRGFHKDNTERVDPAHSDWQTDFSMIRFGIYLNDYIDHSGGLKLRAGSHRHADVSSGRMVDVPSRAGDVVVWYLTTTHSGNVVKMRGARNVVLSPRLEFRLPAWMCVPEPALRAALFMTFALDDQHLRNYLDKHRNLSAYPENYLYTQWLYSHWPEERIRAAAENGCRFLRPCEAHGSLYAPDLKLPAPIVPKRGKPDNYPVTGIDRVLSPIKRIVSGKH